MRAPSAIGLFVLLAAMACDTSSSTLPDLGDAYVVEDQPEPTMNAGRLLVPVSYSGGCQEHEFDLEYRVTEGRTELWLRHDANGDLCEALISETLDIPVPSAAQTPPIRLLVGDDVSRPVLIVER